MRVTRRIAVSLIVALLLPILVVRINAVVFRWRVGHLLNEVKALRVEQTPYSVVSKLRQEYLSNIREKESCDEQRCEFSIDLNLWDSLIHLTWKHPWTERARYYTVLLLRGSGLRPTFFSVWLRVNGGTLRSMNVGLAPISVIEHPEYAPHGFLSNFFATARSAGNFRRLLYRSSIYSHPNLMVWEPSACTGCSGAITAEFTWQASQQELDKAMDFNLSCITRFRDCTSVEQFLPSAAELLSRDEKPYVSWDRIPCDSKMARILGRDSDFVEIAQLTKLGQPDEDNFVLADYKLARPLKGKAPQLKGIYLRSADLADRSRQVGTQSILFLNQLLHHPTQDSHCGVMSAEPDILKAALEGIADDRSGGIENQ